MSKLRKIRQENNIASDSLSEHPTQAVKRSWLACSLPVVTLLLLSPIIVDGLPGTTRLSTLVGLISEIATYGGATLLIRWLGRSRGLSNGALILLGIAYALLEECVFLQTSLTPSFGAPAGLAYGRVWGVRCSGQWATNPSRLYSCPLN